MKSLPSRTTSALLLVALTLSIMLAGAPADAAETSYENGPDPTSSSIEAENGPFEVSTQTVSSYSVSDFGGGTIYYPASSVEGGYGAVGISPGYTARKSSIAWLGSRLASQGFVVFTIDTKTTSDRPTSRGDQLLASLDYLTENSRIKDQVDPNRLAVMGHSMGGGGVFEAAKDRPELQGAIAMAPWNTSKTFSEVSTPTLIFGAQDDTVAPVSRHSIPLYSGLPSTTPRTYLELRGASHFAPNRSNTTIASQSIAWLKAFLDEDRRYDQFLCPGPTTGIELSDVRTNCPF